MIGTRSFIIAMFAKCTLAQIFQVSWKIIAAVPFYKITIDLTRSNVVPSQLPSLIVISYFRKPHPHACDLSNENSNQNLMTGYSFGNLNIRVEFTDDYALEPLHRNLMGSSGGQVDTEGKYLQPKSSVTGKTCGYENHSGPRINIAHSTSVFHRPHVREFYYEIVAYSESVAKKLSSIAK